MECLFIHLPGLSNLQGKHARSKYFRGVEKQTNACYAVKGKHDSWFEKSTVQKIGCKSNSVRLSKRKRLRVRSSCWEVRKIEASAHLNVFKIFPLFCICFKQVACVKSFPRLHNGCSTIRLRRGENGSDLAQNNGFLL